MPLEDATENLRNLAEQAARELASFLTDTKAEARLAAEKADRIFRAGQEDRERGLKDAATYAIDTLLDLVTGMKNRMEADQAQRDRTTARLSSIVSSLGAVVVDTVNGVAGESAGRPGSAPRPLDVALPAGRESDKRYAWVVNRSERDVAERVVIGQPEDGTVTLAVPDEEQTVQEQTVHIPARQRRRITIEIKAEGQESIGHAVGVVSVAGVANLV